LLPPIGSTAQAEPDATTSAATHNPRKIPDRIAASPIRHDRRGARMALLVVPERIFQQAGNNDVTMR
jgi:hypothetical protein